MSNPARAQSGDAYQDPEHDPTDSDAAGWLHWWHGLFVVAIFFAGLLYFPLWRFEQRWDQLQVGDSFERVKELLGNPGEATYTVMGAGASGSDQSYVYTRYWRSYEVIVSSATQRVTSKTALHKQTPPPSKTVP